MQEIPLEKQPNQQFNITLNGAPYVITLRTLEAGGTLADITLNNEPLINGVLCRAGELLIPYPYKAQNGNFVFTDTDAEYPHYTRFGDTCKLYYLTPQELADANNANI